MVVYALQVAGISLLKLQAVETRLRRAFVSGRDEVSGNVDSDHFRPQSG